MSIRKSEVKTERTAPVNPANAITLARIPLSIALLFCRTFSMPFYALYVTAGFSDVLDGAIARRTGCVTGLGSRLDTCADVIFFGACLIKLLPAVCIPTGIRIWIGAIAAVKAGAVLLGYVRRGRLRIPHTVLNKAAGVCIFLLPLTAGSPGFFLWGAAFACALATAAALQDVYLAVRIGSGAEQ